MPCARMALISPSGGKILKGGTSLSNWMQFKSLNHFAKVVVVEPSLSKIPVGHQHGLDLGRSLGENFISIDAMNAEEMNVKDIKTILMKIDRQRCVTVVDTSSDKKPAARIDINELPRKRTKSTESIEHFKFD
jgi:hypothetical protein